jgi:hypothetical protein
MHAAAAFLDDDSRGLLQGMSTKLQYIENYAQRAQVMIMPLRWLMMVTSVAAGLDRRQPHQPLRH